MKNIVLIHGWNYKNYSKYGHLDAWENRASLVNALSVNFNIIKLNLPGFCGEPEPSKTWNIEDFANHFEETLKKNNIDPTFILGYSFGAAIAISWKLKFNKPTKIILVSPAISREYVNKNYFQKLFIIKKLLPRCVVNKVRDLYLRKIKNPYYINGTKFLRETYLQIVKVNMAIYLKELRPEEILLIFGENDSATPPQKLKSILSSEKLQERIKIIPGGGHDIANSHPEIITEMITKFI